MDKQILNKLARQLNLTGLEDEKEEYILTKEEEELVISHELKRLRDHKAWKLKEMGLNEWDIEVRMDKVDFTGELLRDEVLARANSNKLYSIWQEEQREKDRQEVELKKAQLQENYSAKNMFKLMKWTSKNEFGEDFLVTPDNQHFITAICYFLSNDVKFETELGYSLSKGLLIRGISGIGKTFIIRCAANNELSPILILSMLEVSDAIKKDGEFEIKMGRNKIIYLDDVGTEEPVINHYGTRISFFKNFIESYYLRNRNFNRLMISTNNSFGELEEKYGFRVRSRIKDMFNIIDVKGKDMRG